MVDTKPLRDIALFARLSDETREELASALPARALDDPEGKPRRFS